MAYKVPGPFAELSVSLGVGLDRHRGRAFLDERCKRVLDSVKQFFKEAAKAEIPGRSPSLVSVALTDPQPSVLPSSSFLPSLHLPSRPSSLFHFPLSSLTASHVTLCL
jgi:hypothetical protein